MCEVLVMLQFEKIKPRRHNDTN